MFAKKERGDSFPATLLWAIKTHVCLLGGPGLFEVERVKPYIPHGYQYIHPSLSLMQRNNT